MIAHMKTMVIVTFILAVFSLISFIVWRLGRTWTARQLNRGRRDWNSRVSETFDLVDTESA